MGGPLGTSRAPGNLGNNSPLDRRESWVLENLDNVEPWVHQDSRERGNPMVTKAAGTPGIPGYRGQPGQKGDPLVFHVLLVRPYHVTLRACIILGRV
ncbi:hypothetical protein EMCRGX_G021286 [Ephydatia muelleri]